VKGLIKPLIIILVVFGIAFGGAFWFQKGAEKRLDGRIETITAASLQGLREQARLTPFVASFVAVVNSKQERLGLSAEQTMIMPGLVRYELDLNKIQQKDLKWDGVTDTLGITLPPLAVAGPEVDIAGVRQFDGGGILMALTDAKAQLDETNRKAGQAELLKQAKAETPMRLARDAARSAIERSFAMPLRAAGIKATVVARFPDDATAETPAAPAATEHVAPETAH
jgi:hypothetical protein